MICKHEKFSAVVDVHRLTETEGGEVRHFQADIQVSCADCGLDFEFMGMPGGVSFSEPSHGWTREGKPEARMPIRPALSVQSN